MNDDERTSGLRRFALNAFLEDSAGNREPVEIQVDPPLRSEDGWYSCAISSSILEKSPHRCHSALPHDAWACAFESLRNWISALGKCLVDDHGRPIALPSPPGDRSWVPPPTIPDVSGKEPVFRAGGWVQRPGCDRQHVEFAIWPCFEEEPDIFCAPTLFSLSFEGKPRCVYGASAAQANFLAYQRMKMFAEHYAVADENGTPVEVPLPPEPEPIPPP
jgi:hypothetical protein